MEAAASSLARAAAVLPAAPPQTSYRLVIGAAEFFAGKRLQ